MAHVGWAPPSSDPSFVLPLHSTTPSRCEHPGGEDWEVNRVYNTEDLLNSTFKIFSVLIDSVDLIISMHKLRIHYFENVV